MLRKEQITYSRDLALAQIQIDKDKGLERFQEYRKEMFPWVETAKKRDEDAHKKILAEVVKKGPLVVSKVGTKSVRSRLVQRVDRKNVSKELLQQQNALYKRLGKTIPT